MPKTVLTSVRRALAGVVPMAAAKSAVLAAMWGAVCGAAVLAGPGPARAEAAALTPCRLKGVEHEARCGSVERPLDPAQPTGRRISVRYAVLPALAQRKAPDPVFFFAGGPGQSAVALAGPMSRRFARLGNRRDLVFVDQRGTGDSAALKCADDDERQSPQPLAPMLDQERQVQRLADCRAALQQLPHGDLRQYTTTIAMADIDAVREALGAPQINAIGASYGTRAVLEYQRLYPQRVRRVVLDGVVPPDMRLPESFSIDNQAALDALFAACAADEACRRRHPDLAGQWQRLLASLPREVSVQHPLTGHDESVRIDRPMLLGLVRSPLYVPALAAALPPAIAEASAGRFGALVGLATALGGAGGLASGMHFSVVCAEDLPPPALQAAAASAPAGRDFGDAFAVLYRRICADWPRGAPPPGFRAIAPATTATLLLSGGADPVTPPRHGARVAQALGAKARHVVVAEAGHGVLQLACLRDAVARFIDAPGDDEALAIDTGCAAGLPRPGVFVPLAAAAAGGAASSAEGRR